MRQTPASIAAKHFLLEREELRRLDVGQETADFALQALGFDRERVGQCLDVGGGSAGASDTAHAHVWELRAVLR